MEKKDEKVMDMFKDNHQKESMKRWLSAIIIIYILVAGALEQLCGKMMNMGFIGMLFSGAMAFIIGTIYEKYKGNGAN